MIVAATSCRTNRFGFCGTFVLANVNAWIRKRALGVDLFDKVSMELGLWISLHPSKASLFVQVLGKSNGIVERVRD